MARIPIDVIRRSWRWRLGAIFFSEAQREWDGRLVGFPSFRMENTHTYIVGKNFINSHNYHYTSSDCFPFFLALLNVCGRVTRYSCQVQENSPGLFVLTNYFGNGDKKSCEKTCPETCLPYKGSFFITSYPSITSFIIYYL